MNIQKRKTETESRPFDDTIFLGKNDEDKQITLEEFETFTL